MGKSYLPNKDSALLSWALNFAKCLNAHAQVLKLDSKMVIQFQSLALKFKTAMEKAADPEHTHMDVVNKNETKNELRQKIRSIVSGNLNYNPEMTSTMRSAMGLNPRETYRSKAQMPTGKPRIELKPGIRQMTVRYIDETSGRRAKPKGVRGIIYHWAILNEPPKSPEDLNRTASKTSGPLTLHFEENQRGNAFYISARWENTIGEPGPWSDIVKSFIA